MYKIINLVIHIAVSIAIESKHFIDGVDFKACLVIRSVSL